MLFGKIIILITVAISAADGVVAVAFRSIGGVCGAAAAEHGPGVENGAALK
jgi:hypothetical protein